MLASFIMCQACGCIGRAGNTLSQNQSESPVFRYHGHDPFEGVMRFTCANCKAILVVDPMDMLASFCVSGFPESMIHQKKQKRSKTGTFFRHGKILRKMARKMTASKQRLSGKNIRHFS